SKFFCKFSISCSKTTFFSFNIFNRSEMVLSPAARQMVYCFNSSIDNPAPFKCSKNFNQLASSSL
ncbi:conserved hypothetical protein, partial [Listeria monocytogenes FSL F2-208]